MRPHRRQPTRLPRPWDSPGKNTGVGCHFFLQCMKVKSESEIAQSCPTLRDPMECSLPGSSAHGIFQARVLEWGAIAFSDWQTRYIRITWEAFLKIYPQLSPPNLWSQNLLRWDRLSLFFKAPQVFLIHKETCELLSLQTLLAFRALYQKQVRTSYSDMLGVLDHECWSLPLDSGSFQPEKKKTFYNSGPDEQNETTFKRIQLPMREGTKYI